MNNKTIKQLDKNLVIGIILILIIGIIYFFYFEKDTKNCFINVNYGCKTSSLTEEEIKDGHESVKVCDERECICFRNHKGFFYEKLNGGCS